MRLITVYDNPESLRDKLHGIDYLDSNDLFHLYDVFDNNFIDRMLKEKGKPGVMVNDAFLFYDEMPEGLEFIGLPSWLEQEAKKYSSDEFDDFAPLVTRHCFNFMINKKLVNRYLLLKLVELFRLTNMCYTWSGSGKEFDMSGIINELNQLGNCSPLTDEQRASMFQPVGLIPHFIETPSNQSYQPENTIRSTESITGSHVPYAGNKVMWEAGLCQLFSTSAVALISESCEFQKGAVYTEKSLFSVLGLNFPIWIGGYKQAEYWEKLGFDIFSDVIDHSYQYHDTLIERCYWAFAKNIKILTDKDFAKQLRESCCTRLLHNRTQILSDIIGKYTENKMSQYSKEIQETYSRVADIYHNRGLDSKLLNSKKVR
jgi:hypothetical protein